MTSHVTLRHALVAFVFVVLVVATAAVAHRPSRRASRLGLRGLKRRRALEESASWSIVEPFVRWIGVQVSRTVSDELRTELDLRLMRAGDPLGLTADEYAASSLAFALLGLALGSALRALAPALDLAAPAAGATLGALAPSVLLASRTRARQLRIRRGLPYVLDVLCLALGAGSDFTGAVGQVVDKARSNLEIREEFSYFLRQLQVGQSRMSALRELAARVPIAPVRELALAIEQAEERGNAVVTTLEIQAIASRVARTNEAQQATESAGAKMVLPTMALSVVGLYFVVVAMSFFEKSLLYP